VAPVKSFAGAQAATTSVAWLDAVSAREAFDAMTSQGVVF
jgi:hypothetical protein